MEKTILSPQFSVSEQITLVDLEQLKHDNVEVLVCNRPDGEEAEQINFVEFARHAKQLGIEPVHIPFTVGNLKQEDIDAFKKILKTGKKIHAYCRTGKRSSMLWQEATQD